MMHVARRVIHGLFLLVGASLLCFLFVDLTPGHFFDEMKLNPQISPATVAALESRYGINKPLPTRYFLWLESVAKGEWGYSLAYNSPVRALIIPRAENTLLLTGVATAFCWIIAILLGTWAASRPGSWIDRLCLGGTSLLLAIPELVLALAFIYLMVRTHALPVGGMWSLKSDGLALGQRMSDLVKHMAIPVAVLVLAGFSIVVRHVRASMKEVLHAPFIQAARGHGISETRLLFHYALPAASNPLVSLFGFSIGGLLSASLLVETVVGWPGLGPFLLEAASSRDLYVVVGVVMVSTFFTVLGNFIADILLTLADPRIRAD